MALEKGSAKPYDDTIVPPDEAANDAGEQVGAYRKSPKLGAKNVLWCHSQEDRYARVATTRRLVVRTSQHDGQKDTNADDSEDDEDVPKHANEAQEDDGVHTDLLDELLLLDLLYRSDPAEKAIVQGWRGMFLISMLGSGSIDGIASGSQETEGGCDDEARAEGPRQGSEEGSRRDLWRVNGAVAMIGTSERLASDENLSAIKESRASVPPPPGPPEGCGSEDWRLKSCVVLVGFISNHRCDRVGGG